MQTTIGIFISLIVVAVALGNALGTAAPASIGSRVRTFVVNVFGTYVVGAGILGVVWMIASLDTLFQQAIMWLVDVVFWFMPTIH